jgi:hypothetical protein
LLGGLVGLVFNFGEDVLDVFVVGGDFDFVILIEVEVVGFLECCVPCGVGCISVEVGVVELSVIVPSGVVLGVVLCFAGTGLSVGVSFYPVTPIRYIMITKTDAKTALSLNAGFESIFSGLDAPISKETLRLRSCRTGNYWKLLDYRRLK